ncbi:hypothetical protein [Clostridium botulinum]|uniref:hypothetical protein n=1 Tax=Clostridium botulinum TaxID=1491 RepID=UPI001E4F9B09|nr:hypothetical protein [Clostridium botulinum]MCD3223956.1 hypothetical protein [Clostridium botulinum C/D]MCD3298029.1 hypothetical protein [Clostridium botulinum C/D]
MVIKNLDKYKQKYIVTKSIDCMAYILYATKLNYKMYINTTEEDGSNVFTIARNKETEKAYSTYKDTAQMRKDLICNIHFYNYCIGKIKKITKIYKENQK